MGALPRRWHDRVSKDEVKRMTPTEHVPADFTSIFRQRFAPLFGRKIGRLRAEQYLGGLLGGRADRRNVTSLADTVDGATARALGWLLNKSPWPTRPVVDALQTYVGDTFGAPDGLFTLNLDSFVKRGDNAVGVEKQYVHHLGRPQNCQIGVFLAYGALHGSSLVDAALYLPHSWIDSAPRRTKAGVPESLTYQPRSELAAALLREARAAGHLPGEWVTSWHGEGFEADLRARLDADDWRYLLPAPLSAPFYPSLDAARPHPASELLAAAGTPGLSILRVWEQTEDAARRATWLLGCTDALTGQPVAFISNAPQDVAPATLQRVMAARWTSARMLAARCAGVSLDVYRVRGWDGWHRHVALALLASAFRACLPAASDTAPAAPYLESPIDDIPAFTEPVVLHPADDVVAEEPAVAFDVPLPAPESLPAFEAAPEPVALPEVAAMSTYHLRVDLAGTDWRAVRAFQVWLVADNAGTVIASSPTRAEIEAEQVGQQIEMSFESAQSMAEIAAALDDVPEIVVLELQSGEAGAEAREAAASASSADLAVAAATTYRLIVDFAETDWRAVRAFQTWLVADEAGTILHSSPSRAEIERQEVGATMEVRFESERSLEQLLAALDEVPEIAVVELAAQMDDVVAVVEALVDAADASDAADLDDTDALLAALQEELSARSNAREAGLMPAFEGPAEVIGNAVEEAKRVLEPAHELVGAYAGNGQANGYANGNGAVALAGSSITAAPPSVPPTEAPVRPAALAQPSTAPVPSPAPEVEAAAPAAQPEESGKKPAEEKARPAEEQIAVLDLGSESYGIPVQRVREIIRVPPITRVPNGPAFLEGVINLRGQVIPVMDLRKHLGIPSGEETRRSRVVVSELGRHTVGLIVDGVSEVVMVSTSEIEPPPALIAGANDGQVRGVAKLGDRLVLFLDPDRVLPNR